MKDSSGPQIQRQVALEEKGKKDTEKVLETEAETGVMSPQDKECQGSLAATRS